MNRLSGLAVGFFVLLGVSQGVASASPEQLVRDTVQQVLDEVSQRGADLQQDPAQIYPLVSRIVLPRFDFGRMSELVLGRHWGRASEAQRGAFITQFRELLVRTYATALLNYQGQEIRYLPFHATEGATDVSVGTEVSAKGAPPIPINYSLYKRGEEWQVYDVVIDGVSLVANYRSGFAAQIRRYKLDGLIEKLAERNGGGK
ncbi:MAG: ABC transporter substrate-binding protein [Candidatus Sedimenticola endophacoides]